MLTSRIGLNGLICFVRQTSTFSLSAGIQKSHCLSTSQSLNIKSKENFLFPQKCNLFESNLLKQGLSHRTFSTKVTEDSEKENTKAEFPEGCENDQWTLVVGFPRACSFESTVTKVKFFFKVASALIVPWATYTYATGYMSLNWLAATYGSVLIFPLTLCILFSEGNPNRMAVWILMDKNNENILIRYFTTFLKLKQEVIPIEDIILENSAVKTGLNIQGLILSKKSHSCEWFYLPSKTFNIFHEEKAKKIFNKFDVFTGSVYKNKKK